MKNLIKDFYDNKILYFIEKKCYNPHNSKVQSVGSKLMKKTSALKFLFFFALLFLMVGLSPVYASNHGSFKIYQCTLDEWDEEECFNSQNRQLYAPELPGDYQFQPGEYFILAIDYTYYAAQPPTMYAASILFNSNIVEVVGASSYYSIGSTGKANTDYGGPFPPIAQSGAANMRNTNWRLSSTAAVNIVGSTGELIFTLWDTVNPPVPLVQDGTLIYFLFRVNPDAPGGSLINFDFNPNTTANFFGNKATSSYVASSFTNATYSVFGEKSSDATLSDLKITAKSSGTNYPLTPAFAAEDSTREFTLYVPNSVSAIEILATAKDSTATIFYSKTGPIILSPDNVSLDVGLNQIEITVQAEDPYTPLEIYTINIIRLSNDVSLSSLTLTGSNITLTGAPGATTYNQTVAYAITNTTVNATTTHSNATVSGTGSWNLSNFGATANTRTLTVNAENCKSEYASVIGNSCTSQTYTININRENPSTNANLSALTAFGTSVPSFNSGTESYTLATVENSTSTINIGATVQDTGKATITSGTGSNIPLNEGDNTFDITVTAEDGTTTKTYTINVRRKVSNCNLSAITMTPTPEDPSAEWNPAFMPNFYNYYTYTVNSTVTSVNVAGTLEDNSATLTGGFGDYALPKLEPVQAVVTAEAGNICNYIINIARGLSSNNNLSDLTINEETIAGFAADSTLYTLNVTGDTENITIGATVEDTGKATIINGIGTHPLNIGPNSFQVRVRAENGAVKDYTINVNREAKKIADLSEITIDGTPLADFDKDKITYNLPNVAYTKTEINIGFTKVDADSTVTGTGIRTLNTGSNTIEVVVTAQDGVTTKTYTIYVTRNKNNGATLSNLTVAGYSVTPNPFNPGTLEYNITVPNSKTTLSASEVTATPTDPNASVVKMSSLTLLTGVPNTYTIDVTAEDGITNLQYIIKVTRTKSSDARLATLGVTDGSFNPSFNPGTFSYTVTVPIEATNFDVSATVFEEKANITSGLGNYPISGATTPVTIAVTAEDGTIQNYTLTVNRALSSNNNLSSLTLTPGGLNEPFVPGTTLYTANVAGEVTSVNIAAVVEDTGRATIVSGTGSFPIAVGSNTFQVVVKSESGAEKPYTITVTRAAKQIADLTGITVDGTPIAPFASDTISYTLPGVEYSKTDVNIGFTKADNDSTVTGGGIRTLNTGNNVIDLVVTAQDGTTTKTYTININRTKNNVATLNTLTVSGTPVTPSTIQPGLYVYNITVPNSKTTLSASEVTATPTDSNASVVKMSSLTLLTGTINQYTIDVTAENGTTTLQYIINVTRTKSSDARLATLGVTDGSFNPSFNPGTFSYTVTVPIEATNFDVSATAFEEKANITSGLGNYPISGATTPVTITVTAEDGTIETYNLTVNRALSSNNNLSSLTLTPGGLNEQFAPGTTLYTASVPGDVTSISLSAVVEDTGRATIVSGLGSHPLNIGPNTFQIVVKAESGAEKPYTITVTRAAKIFANLTEITVDGTPISDFNEGINSYTIADVPYSKTSVEIGATKADADSTVTGTGIRTLNTGNNPIDIVVTAQDGVTTKTYIVNIYRELNNNNYLRDLKVDGVTIPGFLQTENNYSLTVPNSITSLNLQAVKDATDASVLITDNANFITTGINRVKITVTAENGLINVYYIDVTREKSSNNFLSNLTPSVGVLNPVFDRTKLAYEVVVPRSTDTIGFTYTQEDSSSTVNIVGSPTLSIGNNIFTIEVFSENGIKKEYVVTVKKEASANNYLIDLTIDNVTVSGFSKTNPLYTVNVPSTTTGVMIGGSKEDPNASVSGFNYYTLNTGSTPIPITVTAEDESDRTYTIIINREQSNNNRLSSLTITQTILNSTFDPELLVYSASVGYNTTNIDINALVEDTGKASVTGDGNKPLNTGLNTFSIEVTAEDNTIRTYVLNVTRAKNNNANLSNVILSGGFDLSPDFAPNTENYRVEVPYATTTMSITPYKEDPNAIVTGGGVKTLTTGSNTFDLEVTAENGTTKKTYTIEIIREKSSNADLRNITTPHGSLNPIFDKGTLEYTISVPNEVTNLDLIIVKDDDAASYIVTGDVNLPVGEQEVYITVQAEDGTLNYYKITVTRELSANNFLNSLIVRNSLGTNYLTDFNKETMTYTVNVPNDITDVTIAATTEDENATIISGLGSKSLTMGSNNISVEVRSANNVPRTYHINVLRAASGNANLSSLIVSGFDLVPEFSADEILYTVDVPSNVSSVDIIAEPEAMEASMTGNGTFSISTGVNTFQVKVVAENGIVSKTYSIVVNKAASDNTYLANLTVSPGSFAPTFNKFTTEYTMEVENDVSVINIGAETEDATASVSGTGNKTIPVGTTTYEVVVTAENNVKETYKITVTRKPSTNNFLLDLTVDGETVLNFNRSTFRYTMNVDNSKTKVDVGAVTEDMTASVSGTGTGINLATGENTIQISVLSQANEIQLYEIIINRAKSNNNYLTNISALEGVLQESWERENLAYSMTVLNEVTSLNLSFSREVITSTVEVDGNADFNVGSNTVYINVIAENGDLRIYTLTVYRQPFANNFLSSITVSGSKSTNYNLIPSFDRAQLNYNIIIPDNETTITIDATMESASTSLSGTGTFAITENPQIFEVKCTSTGGITRTYTITVGKALATNNKLSNLTVSEGDLEPAFDPDEFVYFVDVPTGTTTIDINAIVSDPKATVSGDGTKVLTKERNTFNVSVKAEDGSIQIYSVIVFVEQISSNKLASLTVSEGTLSPAFNPDTTFYMVNVAEEINSITINATAEPIVTISGIGAKTLLLGPNVFNITATVEGISRTYTVVVNRGEFANVYLASLSISGISLNESFIKTKYDYTATSSNSSLTNVIVNATPEDANATVDITGNTNLSVGSNTINIKVTNGTANVTYTINLTIGETQTYIITSNIHTIDDDYIQTVKDMQTVTQLISEMTNPASQLKLFNADGTDFTDSYVGSGMILKLIVDGVVHDSKIIIIRGDLNGTGEIDVADLLAMRTQILNSTLSGAYLKAADINQDGDANVADLLQLRAHLLGTSNIHGS